MILLTPHGKSRMALHLPHADGCPLGALELWSQSPVRSSRHSSAEMMYLDLLTDDLACEPGPDIAEANFVVVNLLMLIPFVRQVHCVPPIYAFIHWLWTKVRRHHPRPKRNDCQSSHPISEAEWDADRT